MRKIAKHIVRIILWMIAIPVMLVVLASIALYIPAVQDFAKNYAIEKINSASGMHLSLDKLRLRFPLNLELRGAEVLTASADTMLTARKLTVEINPIALFSGKADVKAVELDDGFYQLGNADSLMWLRANVNSFIATGTDISLDFKTIKARKLTLAGGDVWLRIRPDTIADTPDTTAKAQMLITANSIAISDLRYSMLMLPVIDTLGTELKNASIRNISVAIGPNRITADKISVALESATYLTPAQSEPKPSAEEKNDTSTTVPWDIRVLETTLTASSATYGLAGAEPKRGFDPDYISASGIKLAVDSFRNCGSLVSVPLRKLEATERCGLTLDAAGRFVIDSTAMKAEGFRLQLNNSSIDLDAIAGTGNYATEAVPLDINVIASISPSDIDLALPTVSKMTAPLGNRPVNIAVDITGTTRNLSLNHLGASVPRLLSLQMSGEVYSPFNIAQLGGNIELYGRITEGETLKKALLPSSTASVFNIPSTVLNGTVNYSPYSAEGKLTAICSDGHLGLDAQWTRRNNGYDIVAEADRFPIQAFLPGARVSDPTLRFSAKGNGFNPLAPGTASDISLKLDSLSFRGHRLSDILLDAHLENGDARGNIESRNPGADLAVIFDASLNDTVISWNMEGDIRSLDLEMLHLADTTMRGSLTLSSKGVYKPIAKIIDGNLDIGSLSFAVGDLKLETPGIETTVSTSDSTVSARVQNGDLNLIAVCESSLDSLLSHITQTTTQIDTILASKRINVHRLQRVLPPLHLQLDLGQSNIVGNLLAQYNMSVKNFNFTFSNDSLIHMGARAIRFQTGDTRLDTVTLGIVQTGPFLAYKATLDNKPGNLDNFAKVALNGFIADDKASMLLQQSNVQGATGFRLGLGAEFNDSTVRARFIPFNPVIGYKNWALNSDNFVEYNLSALRMKANIEAKSAESLIRLYTIAPTDSVAPDTPEDAVLQIKDIHLAEWLAVNPFAPPVAGDLDADLRFRWSNRTLSGHGTVGLENLTYGKERVGDFDLEVDIANNSSTGLISADVAFMVDSIRVITATGALNDSTAANPFHLDFSMIHLPLRIANPFLPKEYAQLKGMLNGQMEITGTLSDPIFNGFIDFDSTEVAIGMLGSKLTFDEERIPVDSNVVNFNDYKIYACNKNPLRVNGTVGFKRLSDYMLDLKLDARNMQIVNSSRPRNKAQIYGKGFINADISVGGNNHLLNVDADLNILEGTNITYVVTQSARSLASQNGSGEMVKFVEFNDTVAMAKADSIASPSTAIILDANLAVSQGAVINADLPGDGQNKVSVHGDGNLTFSMNPFNNGRLTGRFTISSGFVRYSPPVLSLLNFQFTEGSYIAFTGDMLNPTLAVTLTEPVKANVTAEGQNSRIVEFIVSVTASRTLQNLDVSFDLAAENDITVQNELAAMTPQQRANQAMNLLLYNTYTGPETSGSSNLSGNPVYSFLTSQLNSWAANNIRGVDISFGIDQYNKTTDGAKQQTTSYSYQVSKTLFNDRFKIVVGGNYSTDASADENFSENLISDISFEYLLNRSGSMYVRLFRHTGYESILEGEVTQTGAGFVYKRKVNSLRDVFNFLLPKRKRENL